MLPADRLRDKLTAISGKGFQAYQELAGAYRFDRCTLYLDSIQPDPMAAASRARIRVDLAEAQVPPDLYATPVRRAALFDYLSRAVAEAIRKHVRTRWSGRISPLAVDAGGQAVLPRASISVGEHYVEARVALGLPSEGRKVMVRAAQGLLLEELPAVAAAALTWPRPDGDAATRHVRVVEDYHALCDGLDALGLVAFVADGALLAREPGHSDGPLRGGRAAALRAPEDLAVTVTLPHRGAVRGLGIPRGVTVITGGTFQGKSTLLAAIGRAVYPHVPGDGRELVAALPDAVTIRADAGRRVERVDVSAFLREVPQRADVTALSVEHASGMVSMAAAIVEALEVGTRLVLVDEDDAAIGLLARDAAMRALIPATREPVTPLLDCVRALWEQHGTSTVIATGGLGDYLAVADTVILMEGFQPVAATARARQVAPAHAARGAVLPRPSPRCPLPRGLGGLRGRRLWAESRGRSSLGLGRDTVELASLWQLVDPSQARAAGDAILYAIERGFMDGHATIGQIVDRVLADVGAGGLEVLAFQEGHPGDHALPRRHEIAAVLNRLRSLQVRPSRVPDAAPPDADAPDTAAPDDAPDPSGSAAGDPSPAA
jgi:predicted ABC-class ATPase